MCYNNLTDDLNKNQIILLTLLISFVTSIATGIITTSLLQEAPVEVTRNINPKKIVLDGIIIDDILEDCRRKLSVEQEEKYYKQLGVLKEKIELVKELLAKTKPSKMEWI